MFYEYVGNYENYLKTALGKTSVEARLITHYELILLGCDFTDNTCRTAPSWACYLIGTLSEYNAVFQVHKLSAFTGLDYKRNDDGVLPVIISLGMKFKLCINFLKWINIQDIFKIYHT